MDLNQELNIKKIEKRKCYKCSSQIEHLSYGRNILIEIILFLISIPLFLIPLIIYYICVPRWVCPVCGSKYKK